MSETPSFKMKIAVIRQRYNPYGGAERFVERALGALVKKGASVTLITRSWEGANSRDGYDQLICDPPGRGRVARDRSFAQCAQAAMRSGSFDITQAHERIPGCMIFRAGDGVHAAWLDHLRRVRGLLGRFGLQLNPYHRYVLRAEHEMFSHPALCAVICNSEMVRDEILRYYNVEKDKLHVIYNGIDLDAFHPDLAAQHRETLRHTHGIAESDTLFLFVGNGFERKGVPQLLRSFASMRHLATARLVIIGGDRKLRAMKKLAARLMIADRVLFTGPQKDVKPWYGAADAFVLPTLYDPFPNAALEAMACGLPVIVSKQSGTAELIESGIAGFVCDALDVSALSMRLDELTQPEAAASMRPGARAAVAHLGLEAMGARLLALYQELALSRAHRTL